VRRVAPYLPAAALYTGLSVLAWWHLWAIGASRALPVGWGDPSQQVWFLAWLPHALGQGSDPLLSREMFAPKGLNLVANSSILLPALLLSPVTVTAGPLVAYAVGLVAAPATSALAAFAVLRRYAPYAPAAFLGGLLYGFSPLAVRELGVGHLHIGFLGILPVVFLLGDEILVRQRRSPISSGALLGLCVAAQFFTSLEVLAIAALVAALGVLVLAARHPREALARAPHAAAALGVAALVAGVLLAYPLWFLVAGPRHYAGELFAGTGSYAATVQAIVWPYGHSPTARFVAKATGDYLGIPLVALLGAATWRLRSGTLGSATAMGLVSWVLTLRVSLHTGRRSTGIPLPDVALEHVPLLENVIPSRFAVALAFFAALGLAVVLDRLHDEGLAAFRRHPADLAAAGAAGGGGTPGGSRHPSSRRRGLAVGAVGAAALVLPALATPWPYAARPLTVPPLYQSAPLRHLRPGTVLLGYPLPNGFHAAPLAWQAIEGFPYALVGGYAFVPGPGGRPIGSLPVSPVTLVFAATELGTLPPRLSPASLEALREEIARWHVGAVVVLPRGRRPERLASLLAEVLGRPPERLDGAWAWLPR
jgi:hypothetical protein